MSDHNQRGQLIGRCVKVTVSGSIEECVSRKAIRRWKLNQVAELKHIQDQSRNLGKGIQDLISPVAKSS